jgi:hypothetical protein
VRESREEMERVEELVGMEDLEIEGIERRVREVEGMLEKRSQEEWEWYRKEVAR